MTIYRTWRNRSAALGLAGVAVVAGIAGAASPAAGASSAKSSAPAQQQSAARVQLPSAVVASSARALAPLASQDGACDVGDVCQYYLTSQSGFGSKYDTAHNDPNLNNNRFISIGSGRLSIVGNNSEFIWNRDPRTSVIICTGANYTGTCGTVGPNVSGNLTATYKNQVESLYWADSAN